MINAVLLQGFLSREKLDGALEEIRPISFGSIPIIIASDGGDGVRAVDFVETLKQLPSLKFEVKIYEASSTAAYIALALSEIREMSKNAALSLHRGEIRLSPTEVSPDGKINENLTSAFRKYDNALVEVIKKTGLDEPKLMSEFYASDWLRLSAEECLRRNIVQRLF